MEIQPTITTAEPLEHSTDVCFLRNNCFNDRLNLAAITSFLSEQDCKNLRLVDRQRHGVISSRQKCIETAEKIIELGTRTRKSQETNPTLVAVRDAWDNTFPLEKSSYCPGSKAHRPYSNFRKVALTNYSGNELLSKSESLTSMCKQITKIHTVLYDDPLLTENYLYALYKHLLISQNMLQFTHKEQSSPTESCLTHHYYTIFEKKLEDQEERLSSVLKTIQEIHKTSSANNHHFVVTSRVRPLVLSQRITHKTERLTVIHATNTESFHTEKLRTFCCREFYDLFKVTINPSLQRLSLTNSISIRGEIHYLMFDSTKHDLNVLCIAGKEKSYVSWRGTALKQGDKKIFYVAGSNVFSTTDQKTIVLRNVFLGREEIQCIDDFVYSHKKSLRLFYDRVNVGEMLVIDNIANNSEEAIILLNGLDNLKNLILAKHIEKVLVVVENCKNFTRVRSQVRNQDVSLHIHNCPIAKDVYKYSSKNSILGLESTSPNCEDIFDIKEKAYKDYTIETIS